MRPHLLSVLEAGEEFPDSHHTAALRVEVKCLLRVFTHLHTSELLTHKPGAGSE